MRYFSWILDVASFPFLKGSGGVSRSYILPLSIGTAHAQALAGSTVWMVLREATRDVLFAKIHITLVEQFEDGYQKDDFLLSIDLSKSFRISNDPQSNRFEISSLTGGSDFGISELKLDLVNGLQSTVVNQIQINLRPPPLALLNLVPVPLMTGSSQAKARRAIACVTEYLPLENIWAAKSPMRFNPFANFAFHKIAKEHGQKLAEDLGEELSRIDPTVSLKLADGGSTSPAANLLDRSQPKVDTDLVPIDIKKIYARRFVANETPPIDFSEMTEKIEKAEKAHQDMLRDIAAFLEKNGICPFQSTSIDLSVEGPNGLVLFELKSSNVSNILSQSAKGTFQLACYKTAILSEQRIVKGLSLILQKSENLKMDSYVHEVLAEIGISVFFYDNVLQWPGRIGGLLDFIHS